MTSWYCFLASASVSSPIVTSRSQFALNSVWKSCDSVAWVRLAAAVEQSTRHGPHLRLDGLTVAARDLVDDLVDLLVLALVAARMDLRHLTTAAQVSASQWFLQ